jgi:outer membrane protein insertion porin family
MYYSAGASVISDIPAKAHWPVKAHLWVNAGRLDSFNQGRTALGFVLLQQRAYESFQFAA